MIRLSLDIKYNSKAEWNKIWSSKNRVAPIGELLKIVFQEIEKAKVLTVLDVGCGDGAQWKKKYRPNGLKNLKISGIDISKIGIRKSREIGINAKRGKAEDIPYPDNSFDCVVCTEVIEHLERPIDAISEMMRVAKKLIIISCPDDESASSDLKHLWRISRNDIRDMVMGINMASIVRFRNCKSWSKNDILISIIRK